MTIWFYLLARLVRLLATPAAVPERAVVITIDDGYRSVYTGAWPILRQYGYPFTVFLYVEAVEKKYREFLSWKKSKRCGRRELIFRAIAIAIIT